MTSDKAIPFTWNEIEDQVRDLVIAQAATLREFGPQDTSIVAEFLGFETDADLTEYPSEVKDQLDPTRHSVFHDAYAAYHYLYQLEDRHLADYSHWNRIGCGLLSGCYPTADPEGETTPLCPMNNPPLRQVLQGFFARFGLEVEEHSPSLADLSILSGLSEASVRASLSKEGFSIEKSNKNDASVLPAEDAIVWLKKRRGFIPNKGTISPEALQARQLRIISGDTDFPQAIGWIIEAHEISESELASKASVDGPWLAGLIEGKQVAVDIDALVRLSEALGLPRSKFVARAVEHLLAEPGRTA